MKIETASPLTACCQIAGCSLFYGKTDISQAGIYSNAANSCLVCIGIACMLYPSVYACALVSIVLRCQKGMPGLFPVLFCDAEEPLPSAGTGSSASSYGLSYVAGKPFSWSRISSFGRLFAHFADIQDVMHKRWNPRIQKQNICCQAIRDSQWVYGVWYVAFSPL